MTEAILLCYCGVFNTRNINYAFIALAFGKHNTYYNDIK